MRRTVYVLTDARGWSVYGICTEHPATAPDPMEAIQAGCAWLSLDVAFRRLRSVLSLYPKTTLGIANVELVLTSGGWVATAIAGAPL